MVVVGFLGEKAQTDECKRRKDCQWKDIVGRNASSVARAGSFTTGDGECADLVFKKAISSENIGRDCFVTGQINRAVEWVRGKFNSA